MPSLSTILKNIWAVYFLTVIGCLFFSGSIIRIYGETCGISIYKPSTWFTTIALMGSPYCRMLNYIGQISGSVMEHFWIHMITTTLTRITMSLPFTVGN